MLLYFAYHGFRIRITKYIISVLHYRGSTIKEGPLPVVDVLFFIICLNCFKICWSLRILFIACFKNSDTVTKVGFGGKMLICRGKATDVLCCVILLQKNATCPICREDIEIGQT